MRNISKQNGFSMIELLIIVAVVGIIATLAIPNLLAARRAANEASAVASIRSYHSAQLTYAVAHGNGNYAGDLTGTINAMQVLANVHLLDNEIGTGYKSGYFFLGLAIPRSTTHAASFVGAGIPASFGNTAPLSVLDEVGHTGSRVFVIETTGVIYWESIVGLSGPDQLTMQVSSDTGGFEVIGGTVLSN